MSKYLVIPLSLLLFISCLFVFDTMEQMRIVNRTNDTILIGRADNNDIDSVKWFLDRWWTEFDSTLIAIDTSGSIEHSMIDSMGNIYISNNDLIPPDSMGCYARTTLFDNNSEHKVYFFIMKLDVMKKYSWKEICRNHLYYTLVVQREMLKEGNIIEYHHKD